MTFTRVFRALAIIAAAVAAPLVASAAGASAPQVTEVFADGFQRVFAADDGKVRLLLLLAPS